MSDKIVFPLSHLLYKSGPIKATEQQELASTHNLPLDRVQSELLVLKGLIESGEIDAPKSMVKLRRLISRHLQSSLAVKHETARMRIQQLFSSSDPKYAVFMRQESGQSAKFRSIHPTLEAAIEVAREHAAGAAGHGHKDFTYYVIEIKHRVGIERGKLVDEPMK